MTTRTEPTYIHNFALQCVFYVPMIIGYLIGLFFSESWLILALLAQFFVGCSQVLSSIYYSIKYDIEHQKKYLAVAIVYILFLFLLSIIANHFIALVLFVCLIPVGMATWYNYNLYVRGQAIKKEHKKDYGNHDETILDDLSLF